MKKYFMLSLFLLSFSVTAQDSAGLVTFWTNLQKHCGKTYEGKVITGGREGDGFTGQRLLMNVLSCENRQIKIPFIAGENRSRTWVLTRRENILELKHDHRHEDGSEDKITMYGGTATNSGSDTLQVFPADPYTCSLISYACGNVWWITLHDTRFTYNLRRIGSDRVFTVEFDLSRPVEYKEKPWGWQE